MPESAPAPHSAQLVVTLDEGGNLIAWLPGANGALRRAPLSSGREAADLRALLLARRDEIAARAAANAKREAETAAARHRRIWDIAAERHGVGFADRTIGQRRDAPPQPRRANAVEADPLADLVFDEGES